MFDITFILKAVVALAVALITTFLIPWIQEKRKSEKLEKVFGIAEQVVYAAWELDITGELLALGMTKAEYAWAEAKKILAKKNMTVDDEELFDYIKSAVASLRIDRKDETAVPEQSA